MMKHAASKAYPVLGAMLFGIFPVLYFYTQNVSLVLLSSLWRILALYVGLILLIFVVCLLLTRGNGHKAANATSVFLLFFNTYGIVYQFLLSKDLARANHYTLLPVTLFAGVYLAWLSTRLRKDLALLLWRLITIIFLALFLFNIARIIPGEIAKAKMLRAQSSHDPVVTGVAEATYPDIYYLIFDEFNGFEGMRNYWHTPQVDDFIAMLEGKGFFVAQLSRSSGTYTLDQMAERLNYRDFPEGTLKEEYYEPIAYNRVFELAKSKGYTTVMFDELSWPYRAMPPVRVDYLFKLDPNDTGNLGLIFDDFGMLVTDNTMVYAFSDYYKLEDFGYSPHRNMIISTVEKLGDMADIPSPRFVYSHLMIPHRPYLYDADGNAVFPEFYRNWDYYEGYWIYSLGVIEEMVDNILEDADPANPPVIILQSDHGARVHKDDYPYKVNTPILFAMYLPGYDTSNLPQDLNPINTFPIVFNHYLGEQIPLQ